MDAKKYNAEIIAMYAAGMLISDITEITGADSDYIRRIATPERCTDKLPTYLDLIR